MPYALLSSSKRGETIGRVGLYDWRFRRLADGYMPSFWEPKGEHL